jgi:hypothetical protein
VQPLEQHRRDGGHSQHDGQGKQKRVGVHETRTPYLLARRRWLWSRVEGWSASGPGRVVGVHARHPAASMDATKSFRAIAARQRDDRMLADRDRHG